jgi:sulfur carrier protein ThiS
MDTCESVEAEPDPIHISPSGFHEKYEFDEVWRNKETREEVRVSIVEKQFVPRDKWSEVAGELDHLRVIQTFGHVTIKEWFDDEKNFYIV